MIKARAFLQYKKMEVSQQCLEFERVLDDMSAIEIITHSHCLKRHNIKAVIKKIYITVHHLRLFAILNEEIYLNAIEVIERYGLPYLLKANDGEDFSVMVKRRRDSFLEIVGDENSALLKSMRMMEEYQPPSSHSSDHINSS